MHQPPPPDIVSLRLQKMNRIYLSLLFMGLVTALVVVAGCTHIGTLSITSEPAGADVSLDNKLLGQTNIDLQEDAGDYLVTIRKSGYQDYRTSVTVREGDTTRINAILTPLSRGTVLRDETISVPAGTYKAYGYSVSPGQTMKVSIKTDGGTLELLVMNRNNFNAYETYFTIPGSPPAVTLLADEHGTEITRIITAPATTSGSDFLYFVIDNSDMPAGWVSPYMGKLDVSTHVIISTVT